MTPTPPRTTIDTPLAIAAAAGTGLFATALGCLYINGKRAHRAELELIYIQGETDTDSAQAIALLDTITDPTFTVPAFIAGALGSATLAFVAVAVLLRLPFLKRT